MSHNHRVVIAGSDSGAEGFAIARFKIFFCRYEDISGGIQAQKFGSPLLRQMIRNNEQAFIAQPKTLAFHSGGDHLERFPSAHFMSQQRIAAVQNTSDSVSLMFPELDFWVHAGQN